MKRSRKVRIIISQLERLHAAALEEFHRSKGGLPPDKCLNCDWTNQTRPDPGYQYQPAQI